jgi:hypothetical protein
MQVKEKPLQIQLSHYRSQFIFRDTQITLGVGQSVMVEFVHDERQIHAAHPGMMAPGFAELRGSVSTSETVFPLSNPAILMMQATQNGQAGGPRRKWEQFRIPRKGSSAC